MRIFSYLYHLVLALLMLGVSILAWSSDTNLRIGFLPWDGDTLRNVLLVGALAGLLFLVLAVTRVLPVLFLVWTVAVFIVLFRGFFLSPYSLAGGALSTALWTIAGALLAIVGAYLQFRKPSMKMAARA